MLINERMSVSKIFFYMCPYLMRRGFIPCGEKFFQPDFTPYYEPMSPLLGNLFQGESATQNPGFKSEEFNPPRIRSSVSFKIVERVSKLAS